MFRRFLDAFSARFPRLSAPLRWMRQHRKTMITLFVIGSHLLGALTSIHAILGVRTSQGAVAWAVSLNTFPYIAVPAVLGVWQIEF
jgi:cardiolipin synthase